MKRRQGALLLVLALALLGSPAGARADAALPEGGAAVAQAQDSNRELADELRRIHREIAALRADLAQPGIKEVFSGLGYILGLFGVAAFVASRRKGP